MREIALSATSARLSSVVATRVPKKYTSFLYGLLINLIKKKIAKPKIYGMPASSAPSWKPSKKREKISGRSVKAMVNNLQNEFYNLKTKVQAHNNSYPGHNADCYL